jgi:cytoskeletal protein CcmA (bactofilin family)
MWKARPDETQPLLQVPQPAQPPAVLSPASNGVKETAKPSHDTHRGDVGHIGKSVVIRGELSGSEDLYLDGEVEGTINLRDHKLVIGPNGKIKAAITARDIVIHGKLEGNINGSERVELKRSSTHMGNIATQRIVIEDGAFFKGAVDIKEQPRESKSERRSAHSAALLNGGSNPGPALNVGAVGAAVQGSFLESK